MIFIKKNTYNPILFLLFLVSGFCGLLYQIVWVRLAFSAFGIITPVLSVVISVFMFGLALGSWAGGRYIETLTNRTKCSAIVFYALMEFLIGIGGFLVPKIFSVGQTFLLSAGNYNSFQYLILSAIIIGISIFPWCVCMGATIPLVMAFIKELHRDNTTGFSYLYLANVIGAMCGTIITAVFLIELLGFHKTLLVAACFNFSIGIVSLSLIFCNKYYKPIDITKTAIPKKTILNLPVGIEFKLFTSILFMTGFTSMAMEIVWVRAFTPVLNTTIYAFAVILCVYLFATWFGSHLYRKHVAYKRVMSIPNIMTCLAYFSFLPIILSDPRIWKMANLLNFKGTNAIAVVISIFPFCAMLGYLTPKLIDKLSHGNPKVAGNVYAINIMGCILGPLFAGYVFLPIFGVRFSLVFLTIPFVGYFLYYFKTISTEGIRYAVFASVLISVFLVTSIGVFLSFEDSGYPKPKEVRRDYVATVISYGKGMNKRLFVNGIGMTCLTTDTKFMAHIALAIRESKPEAALVICLGMGTTFRSAASWDTKTISVELVPSVRDAFGFYFEDADKILQKPNTEIIVDDGRRFLMRTSETFDIITVDPPPPIESSGSGLLYSEEFCRLVKARLKENGILAHWVPVCNVKTFQAITRSIRNVFSYVRVFRSIDDYGYHFFASVQPFDMPSSRTFASRLPLTAKADLTEWTSVNDPEYLYKQILKRELPLDKILTPEVTFSITDDRPFNEYFLLRRMQFFIKPGNNGRSFRGIKLSSNMPILLKHEQNHPF